jgi:hypothetical protein
MKTTLHYYRFDITSAEERAAYLSLRAELKSRGLTCFDSISSDHHSFYTEKIKPLSGSVIELETTHLFNNQWNTAPTTTSTKGLRVFDWSEAIYPNKSIKEGMYLDQTAEMTEIRANTYSCGYCGAQYYKPEHKSCDKCLGSEYLKESDLSLLTLAPIALGRNYSIKSHEIELISRYKEAQLISRKLRLEKRNADKLQQLADDVESAKKEYDAFLWLISNHIDFDNCIYYKYTDKFCFGWRNAMSDEEKEKYRGLLYNFPYSWEFSKK